jgi:peptidoglycan hydrolase-like protein with peptidoglycan-binding domain
LKYGSVGQGVRRLQRALNAAVDARLPITGVYAGSTTKAVRAYQRAVGLAANGVVAANTWAELTLGHLHAAAGRVRLRR